jgi:hypothetical protein
LPSCNTPVLGFITRKYGNRRVGKQPAGVSEFTYVEG